MNDGIYLAALDLTELAAGCKALAHPARLHILRFLLARGSCMCGDIVKHLDLAQSTVSQHLKILKEAGFLRGSISGPRMCYCVDPAAIAQLQQRLQALLCQAPSPATSCHNPTCE